MKLKPNEYQCARCHKVYIKGLTDEEAEKECMEIWDGTSEQIGGALVCDDCWQLINPLNT